MTKRQLIDQILQVNSTADPGFLARFEPDELDAYLRHLREARLPRLAGDPHRFDHYFRDAAKVAYQPLSEQAVAVAEPPDEGEYEDAPQVAPGADTHSTPYDAGAYVSQQAGAVYDVPAAGAWQQHSEPPAASEDALDLSYVPAERDDKSDPETENTQSDSSFADMEEDAEAWLF